MTTIRAGPSPLILGSQQRCVTRVSVETQRLTTSRTGNGVEQRRNCNGHQQEPDGYDRDNISH